MLAQFGSVTAADTGWHDPLTQSLLERLVLGTEFAQEFEDLFRDHGRVCRGSTHWSLLVTIYPVQHSPAICQRYGTSAAWLRLTSGTCRV